MTSPSIKPLQRFRSTLRQKHEVSERTLAELERLAHDLILQSFTADQPIRPSQARREYAALAKNLRQAEGALARLGEAGLSRMYVLANPTREPQELSFAEHLDYLARMARYAALAQSHAQEEALSEKDRGRTRDQNLHTLVRGLVVRFQGLLGIDPTHTVDPDTGLGVSLCDTFVKEAIATYAPDGVHVEPRLTDDCIRRSLAVRDAEFFQPPPSPNE